MLFASTHYKWLPKIQGVKGSIPHWLRQGLALAISVWKRSVLFWSHRGSYCKKYKVGKAKGTTNTHHCHTGNAYFYLMLIWERDTFCGNASSSIWKPSGPRPISSTFNSLTNEPKNFANAAATELQMHISWNCDPSKKKKQKRCMRYDSPPKMIFCYRKHIEWFLKGCEAFKKFCHTNTGQIAVICF